MLRKIIQDLEIRIKEDGPSCQGHIRRHCFGQGHHAGWCLSRGLRHSDRPRPPEVGAAGAVGATAFQKPPCLRFLGSKLETAFCTKKLWKWVLFF